MIGSLSDYLIHGIFILSNRFQRGNQKSRTVLNANFKGKGGTDNVYSTKRGNNKVFHLCWVRFSTVILHSHILADVSSSQTTEHQVLLFYVLIISCPVISNLFLSCNSILACVASKKSQLLLQDKDMNIISNEVPSIYTQSSTYLSYYMFPLFLCRVPTLFIPCKDIKLISTFCYLHNPAFLLDI